MTIAIPEPTLPPALARARELYLAGVDVDSVPCICSAARADHAGPTHAGKCPATECNRYRADRVAELAARARAALDDGFDESMRAYDAATRKKPTGPRPINVRPSDVGACPRSIWYRETPPEGYTPLDSPKGAAHIGTLIDEAFLRRRAKLYPWRYYQFEVTLPGQPRPGRLDEYDPISARLISLKTAGSWRWDVTGQHGPGDKWWDQDHAYAFVLTELGYPVEEIEVLVIEREAGNSERHVMPYDPIRGERVVHELLAIKNRLEAGEVLERTEAGPSTSKLCSTYCPARAHCWNIPEAEALGVSPENYTILGLTPDEQRVESIAEELVGLREQRLAISKSEDELKALLDGVAIRPYGEYEPAEGKSTSTAWNDYRAEVEKFFATPEWDRPAELPEPRKTTRINYTWKRLRKATRDRLAKEKQAALEAAQAALEAPAEEEGTPRTLTVVSERLEPVAELPAAEAS